jgi:hypothetical protein
LEGAVFLLDKGRSSMRMGHLEQPPAKIWAGWPCISKKKMKKSPQRHGADFDPPIINCAFPMKNSPGGSEMPPKRLSRK